LDYYFVKTRTKIYHLGWSWEERYKALSILFQYFKDKTDLIFLREGDLTEKEYDNALWVLKVFGYLDYLNLDDIVPLTHKEFTSNFK
jgi:hypothetical protein